MSSNSETPTASQLEHNDKGMADMKLGTSDGSAVPDTPTSSIEPSLRESPDGIFRIPLACPLPTATPPSAAELSSDHRGKYEEVLEKVKSWTEIPAKTGQTGPLSEDEIMWLSRECLLRYLRATKWNTTDALARILGTLTWRREFDVQGLTGNHISPENETGKQVLFGYDVAARPCLYLCPGKQNTDASPRQVQHLVFMLERAVDLMVPGQENLALLIDFRSSKKRSNTAPPLGQGREVLNILQTHYPERLGRACIINIPWIVSGFFKLITPFIDPLTREKLKFNEDVSKYVPAEQLMTECQGQAKFEYDHAIYWPALLGLCAERHTRQKRRWEEAGKRYGESETYMRGMGPAQATDN